MMRYTTTLTAAICVGSVLVLGCNSANNGGAPSGTPKPLARLDVKSTDRVATVNGKPIPRSAIPRRHRAGPLSPEKIQDEVIEREILRQEAEKQNLLSDPTVAEQVDNALRMAISQAAVGYYIEHEAVTDEEIRKEYEEKWVPPTKVEYKIKQIAVASEAAANAVIAKLKKGEKFEVLAKSASTDTASKAEGGALGWQAQEQLGRELSAALAGLKNGEMAPAPVQTAAGWVVVRREDFRETQPPAFDQVKDRIRRTLQAQKFRQHVQDLKKAAKIETPAAAPSAKTGSAAPPAASDSGVPRHPAGAAEGS